MDLHLLNYGLNIREIGLFRQSKKILNLVTVDKATGNNYLSKDHVTSHIKVGSCGESLLAF